MINYVQSYRKYDELCQYVAADTKIYDSKKSSKHLPWNAYILRPTFCVIPHHAESSSNK